MARISLRNPKSAVDGGEVGSVRKLLGDMFVGGEGGAKEGIGTHRGENLAVEFSQAGTVEEVPVQKKKGRKVSRRRTGLEQTWHPPVRNRPRSTPVLETKRTRTSS